MKCAGMVTTGARRGYSCGAVPKYTLRGKSYCGTHLAIARDEPARFGEAIKAEERRIVREHRKSRQAQLDAAFKENQLDAFALWDTLPKAAP
jgi:hypothetical protein